eukprot:3268130-Pyramimonas_sp.AAC.1
MATSAFFCWTITTGVGTTTNLYHGHPATITPLSGSRVIMAAVAEMVEKVAEAVASVVVVDYAGSLEKNRLRRSSPSRRSSSSSSSSSR